MDESAKTIEKATQLYGDGEPFDVERILDCMEFRSEQAGKNLYAFGRYCLWLKEAVGWGGFVKALESRSLDIRGSYHAMLQVEKFGANFGTVANLGSRKARTIAYFTKEEIDRYVKGGDLRGIPHDDVAKKTAVELEEEVRRLRKKAGDLKAKHEKTVKEMSAEIETLRLRDGYRPPPTKKQIALAAIMALNERYTFALARINSGMREAYQIVQEAEKTPGTDVQTLSEWLGQFDPEMQAFHALKDGWLDEVDNAFPIDVGKIELPSDRKEESAEGSTDVPELG